MAPELIILAIVIVTALVFDFTNGFHDTGNAMATSIATGALKPKVAVALSAILNLVGAFLSIEVAKTVGKEVVNLELTSGSDLMIIVFTGLVGGITWNLLTWLLGLPSSSSHALFGGLIGATIAGLGLSGVLWTSIVAKVIVPAVAAPLVAGIISTVGTALIYRLTRSVGDEQKERGFRWGQVGTASLVSLAHGTNDAQKTMGVIFLALVASSAIDPNADIPFWVKLTCAAAIALGTYLGGWRIIRTLGKGLVEIDSPQGMAAEGASAAIILTSSHFGMALSTTHVATGSILGTGLGRKGAEVRWSVAGRMVVAWIITIPAAAIVGAVTWFLGHMVAMMTNDLVGALVIFALLLGLSGYMWHRSRQSPVTHDNVNDEWQGETPAADGAATEAINSESTLTGTMVHVKVGEMIGHESRGGARKHFSHK
ncbi:MULTISPECIES: inorganic phosphate transporter [Micrococcaceae]|uniref:inorganic phosphate transporter n=1 Tax=unclassified Kocuria TaxID=2649579 RepID=UPI001013C080|nr:MULTISPECIES: inorganic phosphate transporter [unclassified Kocuria]